MSKGAMFSFGKFLKYSNFWIEKLHGAFHQYETELQRLVHHVGLNRIVNMSAALWV
jgi:hypothetical protein